MNKRLPFIALLIAMELALSQLTFGTIGIFTTMLAVFSLRRKDFLIYLLCSSPSALISYIQYGSFWASSGSSSSLEVDRLVYLMLLNPLYFLVASGGIWGVLFFINYRNLKALKVTNKLRKSLNLKPRLYPEIKFKERMKKDRGGKFVYAWRLLTILYLAYLLGMILYFDYIVFAYHSKFIEMYSCWQVENNATAFKSYSSEQMAALKAVLNC